MKLKLDENLGRPGRDLLVASGHDVATAREQRLLSAPDQTVIAVCTAEERALVTLDRDFANPVRYPPAAHAGVAVLRLPRRATPADLDDAINTLIAGLIGRTIRGRLWIVQRGRIREYGDTQEIG